MAKKRTKEEQGSDGEGDKFDLTIARSLLSANITDPTEMRIHELIDECPDDKIPIVSVRQGIIPGTHRVTFTGDMDLMNMDHLVTDRNVFAKGAIRCAEWVSDNQPGVYNITETI